MITQENLLKRLCLYWGLSEDELRMRLENKPIFHRGSSLKDAHLYLEALYHCRDKVCTISADYDPDGIFSGLILYYTLKRLGYTVNILPPSPDDGYGLTEKSLDTLLKAFPETEVILTVDNGISAFDGIQKAKEKGLIVLVTDHHLQKKGLPLPNADVVVNPNRLDDAFMFKGISGTSVIWKLMLEFVRRLDTSTEQLLLKDLQELYVFVGITTISDVMPLVDENVYLMRRTIQSLNTLDWIKDRAFDGYNNYRELWIGLYAFHRYLSLNRKLKASKYDVDTIGFYISPMLNSARRVLDSSKLGFDVFMQSDVDDAYSVILELAKTNDLRKSIMQRLYREADKLHLNSRVLVTQVHGGLVGLLAGRMVESLNGACLVLTTDVENPEDSSLDVLDSMNDVSFVKGSGRAVPGIDLLKILSFIHDLHPEYLHHFGGHAAACGVGVYTEHVGAFSRLFDELVDAHFENMQVVDQEYPLSVSFTNNIHYDFDYRGLYAVTAQDVLNFTLLMEALDVYGPFGQGFAKPLFDFYFESSSFELVGLTEQLEGEGWERYKHLKAVHKTLPIEIVEWNHQSKLVDLLGLNQAFSKPSIIRLRSQVSINRFLDRVTLQLTI